MDRITTPKTAAKPLLLFGLGAEYSTVDVINIAADRQKFMTLNGELS